MNVLDSLLVSVQEKDHGATDPDHEAQTHKVSCREYEYVLTRNFIHLAGLSKEQYTQFILTLTFLLFI